MIKRMIIMIAALVLVLGGIFGWKAFVNHKIAEGLANSKPPPVTVSTTRAGTETWQPTIPSTGSLRAVQGVAVTTEIAGKVEKINFESGQQVKAGTLLVHLDTTVDRAQLQGLKAQLELDRVELKRQKKLVKTNATSQSALDKAQAQYNRTRADVAAKQAEIDKKTIKAPFAGQLGIRQVDLGEYVSPGDNVVTLQALDPIYVDFSIPQRHLPKLKHAQPITLTTDSYPDNTFHGRITTINPKVEEATRNVRVQATLDNAEHRLKPGMFGEVAVLLAKKNQVVTLPQTAVTYNPYGDSVYVVQAPGDQSDAEGKNAQAGKDADSGDQQTLPKVKRVFINTGETRGDQVQILKGIEAGKQVVSAGQLKLREGSRIKIDNEITPSDQASPSVAEN